ncbi:hypothetical protein TWF173_011118 [Orbilia oligospora]|nr:hypothetical protein TWF173_011118 [Orbilia oligospora]
MFISAPRFFALLFLAMIPLVVDADTCLEVSGEEVSKLGQCTIKIVWQKVYYTTPGLDSNGRPGLRDRISAEVYDARHTKISTQTLEDFEFCTGNPGGECKVQSGLETPTLLSPQHHREYLQFWFGNLGWHTDPWPQKGPRFVGEDVKDRTPWCSLNWKEQWVRVPFNRADGGFLSDPNLCSIQPCVTPPPPTTVTATETKFYTSMKTMTMVRTKTKTEVTPVPVIPETPHLIGI